MVEGICCLLLIPLKIIKLQVEVLLKLGSQNSVWMFSSRLCIDEQCEGLLCPVR